MFWRTTPPHERGQVLYLPVGSIRPNPHQPRTVFDRAALQELADSIALYGVLQPLTVRKKENGWELVAGERRLRAARMAGLGEVPCLCVTAMAEDSAMLALIENLQRRDLDYIEQAQGIARLMENFGLSQEEAARRLGKSQSAVANKLRLLRHPPALLAFCREAGLSERHVRALLTEENLENRMELAKNAAENGWSVSKLEQVLAQQKAAKPRFLWKNALLKDARLLLNSLEHSLQNARAAGLNAYGFRTETDTEIVLTIRLPKAAT